MEHDLANWKPILPAEAQEIMEEATVLWWVAGGWAIDLFVGRQTRAHGDLDILVLRRDQLVVQHHLYGWELYAADPPGGLRPWQPGEFLARGIHDIWCRRGPAEPWAFQLMLAEDDGEEWFFRRNRRIRGRISTLGSRNREGIPFVAPEVQLLYKAKGLTEQDRADFAIVAPLLGDRAKAWLLSALMQTYPEGHEWIEKLSARQGGAQR